MKHCQACQTNYKSCDWCDDGKKTRVLQQLDSMAARLAPRARSVRAAPPPAARLRRPFLSCHNHSPFIFTNPLAAGYYNDAQLGECTPCADRWEHCSSCGTDATEQPEVPACFGCEDGWELDESAGRGKATCKPAKKKSG